MPKQHPRLEVAVRAGMDTAGATGQIRCLVNGVPHGGVGEVAFAISPTTFGPANVAGDHMAKLAIEVQVQRTSASGAMRVAPILVQGRQSP
jgi:hypothetical protein